MAGIYHDVILAGWTITLTLGICLLMCRVPHRKGYMSYKRSRRILGTAYIIFGIAIAQFTIFDLRENAPSVAIALPLSYFYLEGILFGMSFCSLLDRDYISRRQMIRDFGGFAIFLAIVWIGALTAHGLTKTIMLVAGSIWFFVAASLISLRFFRIYRTAVRRINEYYADNVEAFVKWLHKSTYGIISLGLSASVLSFAPPRFNTIFMLCGIFLFIYVFVSMQNYILNYEYIDTAVTEDPGEASPLSSDQYSRLRNAINQWVENGGYRESGVTLDKTALALGSNRSYVSAYINSEYQCNFREWINALRIKYAKTLLTDSPDMTIERVAKESGFTSSAYFCRQFSKREGLTPTKWRERESYF